MTPESLTLQYQKIPKAQPIDINPVQNVQSNPFSSPVELSRPAADHRRYIYKRRRNEFDNTLKRLYRKDVIGKAHIEEYLRDQYRRQCSASTIRNSLTAILSFLFFFQTSGRCHVEEISRQDLLAFIEHEQDRGLKPTTVDVRLRSLNCFLRFLIEKKVIRPQVLSKRIIIKVPDALPRAIDPDDVRRLLAVIDHTRDRAMLLTLLRTGMRIGELLNTLVSEVNLKARKIDIYEAQKNRVGRVVYLSKDARKALSVWLKKRNRHQAYLFYGPKGQSLTYPAARMRFKKYLHKSDLSHKSYSLHCLRHTCASELLNAGMHLECVQELLGHSNIEMTRRYARLTDKTREEEYFKAMAIIERGEIDGHYQLDHQLQAFFEKAQLFSQHD